MANKCFYITTPIYYASANLHIGHAYCTVMTDIIARYKRERGYDVWFLTGADEHGEKIARNAEKAGMQPQEFVDKIAANFHENWSRLKISNNDFIRTTDQRHVETVQKAFTMLLEKGDIYLGKYKGWYCTPCESFWTEMQVGEDHVCPDCGRPVHEESEDAYFLNVKKYIPQLLKFYEEHPEFVPGGKLNEMINTFIKPGLDDLCITRTSFTWGIPVRENPKHVVYVWIDALLNYVSALGYLSDDDSKFKKYWSEGTEIVQFAGREINRFHTIYWPILLFALGLRTPDVVYIHGLLLTRSGVKLSKSLGNAPSPLPLIDRYGLDTLRFYMAREVKLGDDGTFTPNQFVERTNMDLVNNYGNLINRTVSMIAKYYGGKIPSYAEPIMDTTKELYADIEKGIADYEKAFDSYEVTNAARIAIEMLDKGNKYIEVQAPWALSKGGETEKLAETMYVLAEIIRVGSIMLRPILVEKADVTLGMLGLPEELTKYDSIHNHTSLGGLETKKGELLFPRLDKEAEVDYLSKLIDGE
ncbi:MAG TPA: methionine--tRNA ligase [Firmicutes bacterium]|nr:methionine--tRNA ligase [Clostridium sp. CAG:288]HAR47863.1 methionine--tRNA ligase [Bacillota bacterium]HAW99674.1 methionine--tRNA ligase [Bacillota bacterium]